MEFRDPLKGRGASFNPLNRFDLIGYVKDEWDEGAEFARRPATEFYRDASKSILVSNDSPDIPFEASLNPYRGCEHGCVYCYARPYHEYLGWSAGLDFETKIMVKEDAPELLRRELASPRWSPKTIAMSGVTDCYQPAERRYQLTRQCLQVLAEFRNPVGIVTKNALVTRDLDVLGDLAAHQCAVVMVSITTLHTELNRVMEPRTSLPRQRLAAIEALTQAGVPAGVMVAPVIPGLNDEEIPSILKAAYDAGARYAGYIMIRLPHAVAPLFEQWLEHHLPGKRERILNRIRSVREGKLNSAQFGDRMRGKGFHAEQICQLFQVSCRQYGFNTARSALSTAFFRRPTDMRGQLNLF
ncbi:MAG: radical SAM protein [Candidatus Hydrogenedentota bacterium]